MKFICKYQLICEAVSYVSKAVASKSTIPSLEGIKLKLSKSELELTGYNLEIGIKTTIPVISDDEGVIVVNTRLFSEITRKMPNFEITFELNDNLIMNIYSGETECTIPVMSAEEYPDLPEVESTGKIEILQTTLKSMIDQTVHATASTDIKPIFTGELFDIQDGCFNLVAMDGFRLAIRTENIDCQDNLNFVVPKKALVEVSTLIKDDDKEKKCIVYTNNKHILFVINGYTVISRLLDGEFHNYKISIPQQHQTEIIINKQDLVSSMERCSLLLSEKNKSPIKCTFENGKVRVECKTIVGKINDVIDADISGETVVIGFNNKFVLDALKATEGDKIKIRLNGSMRVIQILPLEGEEYNFLLMPIQLR